MDGAGADLLGQRRPLELVLDWVERVRVAQPVVAADAAETVAGRAGGQGIAAELPY